MMADNGYPHLIGKKIKRIGSKKIGYIVNVLFNRSEQLIGYYIKYDTKKLYYVQAKYYKVLE